ncbi:MAG: tetratricopeptide repeat protein [Gammaproteobacteria bacterium]
MSRIHRLPSLPVSLLLLSTTLFSTSAPGHAGVDDEIQGLTLQIRQDPASPQLYLQRGDLYRIHRDWNQALADFRKARQLDATAAAAELGLGRTRLDQGSPQQALPHLNRALDRQPGDVRALVTRAETYRALGKPLAAAGDYSRAIEHFPAAGKPLPEYYLERARAYAAAGDAYINEALQSLDEGMQVLGGIQTLALYGVELETGRGNFDAALKRLDPLIARANRKEFLLLERGDILVAAQRDQEARQAFLAAQAAVAALPPRHRQTRSMQQLETALSARLQSADLQEDNEQ